MQRLESPFIFSQPKRRRAWVRFLDMQERLGRWLIARPCLIEVDAWAEEDRSDRVTILSVYRWGGGYVSVSLDSRYRWLRSAHTEVTFGEYLRGRLREWRRQKSGPKMSDEHEIPDDGSRPSRCRVRRHPED